MKRTICRDRLSFESFGLAFRRIASRHSTPFFRRPAKDHEIRLRFRRHHLQLFPNSYHLSSVDSLYLLGPVWRQTAKNRKLV